MDSSWRLKIGRAREHLDSLNNAVRDFLADDPYRVETSREGNDVVVRVRDLSPIPPTLPLIVGDAVHNARSALDHLVMDLAERGQGSLGRGPQTDSEERRLYFPVTSHPSGFREWTKRVEPFLTSSAVEVIEAMQSFSLLAQYETDHGSLEEDEQHANQLLDPLVRLHQLNNQDKHRRLALSLWFPGTVGHGAVAEPELDHRDRVSELITDPKVLTMFEEFDRRESEDPTTADFFFSGELVTEGVEIGRFMRADRGRVVDDTRINATMRIVVLEPGVTGRFLGAPPVQSVVTDLVDVAADICSLIEGRVVE